MGGSQFKGEGWILPPKVSSPVGHLDIRGGGSFSHELWVVNSLGEGKKIIKYLGVLKP